MRSLEALFIDFDGTLVDSEIANANAYAAAIQECGFSIAMENVLRSCQGRHWSEFLPELIEVRYSVELGKEIAQKKKNIYPNYFDQITPNKPVLSLIQSIKKDIPKALVTNASRDSVTQILRHHNLENIFKLLVCQEDIKNPKPSPEGYLRALSLLNVNAEDSLAVEDSESGILAAKKAKIPVLIYG